MSLVVCLRFTEGGRIMKRHIRTIDGWVQVDSEPVQNTRGLDLFWHHDYQDVDVLVVSEGITGNAITTGKNLSAVVRAVNGILERQSAESLLAKLMEQARRSGVSPDRPEITVDQTYAPGMKVAKANPGIGGLMFRVVGTLYRAKNRLRVRIDSGQAVGGARTSEFGPDWHIA